MSGSVGSDTLTGGADGDVFSYEPYGGAYESSLAAMDHITDFDVAAGDRIDLGTLYTSLGTFWDAPVAFVDQVTLTSAPVEGTALVARPAELTWLSSLRFGADTWLVGDLDHDGVVGAADFVVKFDGLGRDLTKADFLEGTFQVKVGTDGPDGTAYFGLGGGDDKVYGLGENDTILSLDGSDLVYGGAGNDSVEGGFGSDQLYGDAGDDQLYGGEEYDNLDGGAGRDTNYGGNGGDYIHAGADLPGTTNQLYGDFGNDYIYGQGGDDLIDGGLDDDYLSGGSGTDTLFGQSGRDDLYGGEGSDRLFGGDLNDSLYGGEGDDLLHGDAGNDSLSGDAGNDRIVYDAADGMIDGGSDWNGLDQDILVLTSLVTVDLGNATDQVAGGGIARGFEGVDFSALGAGVTFAGDARANTLIGTAVADTLNGGAGNDTIDGGAGNDLLRVAGTRASYVIYGSVADFQLTGSGGEVDRARSMERVQFSDGTVTVASFGLPSDLPPSVVAPVDLGGLTEDTALLLTPAMLLAGASDWEGKALSVTDLSVSAGSLMTHPDGTWTYQPAANDDAGVTFSYRVSDGLGSVAQSAALDLEPVDDAPVGASDATATPRDVPVTLSAAALLANDSDIDTPSTNLSIAAVTSVSGGVAVLNTDGSVTFTPSTGFTGLASFTYTPFDGEQAGLPVVVEVTVSGAVAGLVLKGTSAADTLTGGEGNDTIDGSGGNDLLGGAGGADAITAGAGNDTVYGGSGDDRFLFGIGNNGIDLIDGGAGSDRIETTASGVKITVSGLSGVETILSTQGNATLAGTSAGDLIDLAGTAVTGVVLIDGTGGADTIFGSSGADTITGGVGNDLLFGGEGADVFRYSGTGGGFDRLEGGGGADMVLALAAGTTIGLSAVSGIETFSAGGFANVRVLASTGADLLDFSGATLLGISAIDAGSGNDTVFGSEGADTIVAGAGNDLLQGGGGDDVFLLAGSVGTDLFDGGLGHDTIRATAANVVLTVTGANLLSIEALDGAGFAGVKLVGTSAAEVLYFSGIGVTGIERIAGGGGADTITGSAGDDVLDGGAAADRLSGGAGADVFDFNATSESKGSGYDLILDFVEGLDRIDLSTIDANGAAAGDAFVFIGTAAFSSVAGQLRFDTGAVPGQTVITGDINGDRKADIEIHLQGSHLLGAADFLL